MAITKQHILLGAPIWTSTGVFLIQAGAKIASLTSTGLNSVLKCALDLAVVAQRVKSIGRRLGSSIIFLAVIASAGSASAADTMSTSATAEPDNNVPFFLSIDNRATFAYQSTSTQPGIAGKTAKQIFEVSHFDIWRYGANLVIVDLLKSDHADPAAPCLSPTGPTTGCAGATEVYGLFRSTFGFNEILGATAFSKGPLRNVSFLVGADANRDDRYSSARKRSLVAGLQFAFNLPYKGFLNVSPLYYKEANRNAYVRCDVAGGIPGESCLTDGNLAYRGTWAVETSYYMDLGFLPARLQYFSVRGRINFYGPKGGENSPLPSTPTRLEIDSEPIRLSFDVGKAFRGSKLTHKLDLWVAYRYWRNKYGFDHNASPVCIGVNAGSCVEKSLYLGITVKL